MNCLPLFEQFLDPPEFISDGYEMAILFANLGTDSTVDEIQDAYRKEKEYIDLIAELDADKAYRIRASY